MMTFYINDFKESFPLDILKTSKPERNRKDIVECFDFAFQPIVNIHTGICYAFEALLRNYEIAGFRSIQDVFNVAYQDNMLSQLDLWLIEKVLSKFKQLDFHQKIKVFFNLDNRVFQTHDYSAVKVMKTVERYSLFPGTLCLEISEKHNFFNNYSTESILNPIKRKHYKLAIDDFGTGFSGLQLLYNAEPDYIKIDRFFIKDIFSDSQKKLFVSSTLNMAHTLGIMVIAEGVETEKEFYACKNIGCDLVQGHLVQKPTLDINALALKYDEIVHYNVMDRREKHTDSKLILESLEYIESIPLFKNPYTYTEMECVLEVFKRNSNNNFFPLINGHNEPIGLIREKDIKKYVYSRFRKELLLNRSLKNLVMEFVNNCPIADINMSIEQLLEIYSINKDIEGIVISENRCYLGFLSSHALLKLLYDKNITEARDQNPSTKLAVNSLINQNISESLATINNEGKVFVYFDFNHFKPFNDKYGFRQGDRAIILFTDILKEISNMNRCFIGHIGGDDFFISFKIIDENNEQIYAIVKNILQRFADEVQSLYTTEDRNNQFIISKTRDGEEKRFPLLTVSAAVLVIPLSTQMITTDEIFSQIVKLKEQSRHASNKFALSIYNDGALPKCTIIENYLIGETTDNLGATNG